MTTGEKIYGCRKRAGMTQEELAERLGVTRQAVSRWEQDITFPETKQIMELCKLFHISSDELLFGGDTGVQTEPPKEREEETPEREERGAGEKKRDESGKGVTWGVIGHGGRPVFEYISRRRLWGMPLVHICLGLGMCRAHGIFALGIFSAGLVSAGIFSAGILSAGIFAVGLAALGCFVLGGAAFGSVALGLFAAGAIAVGVMSFGAIAIGHVAVGAFAAGQFAVGDVARGWLAVGLTRADGAHAFLIPQALGELKEFLSANVSPYIAGLFEDLANILH